MPRLLDGVFFAILPDAAHAALIKQQTRHLCRELGLTGEPLTVRHPHVSLYNLGSYECVPRGIVAAAAEAGDAVQMRQFDVGFDKVMSFTGRQGNLPLVLRGDDGIAGLMMLHQYLGLAMRNAGLGPWAKGSYTPHLTLRYGADQVGEHAIETIRWTVREFVLVNSLRDRHQYVLLGRWPLCG